MRTKTLMTLGLLAFSITSTGQTPDPRLGLSGIWSGLRKQIPLAGCKKSDDGETPSAITLRVEENGVVTGKDSTGKRLTGNIGEDFSLSLQMKGRAKCASDQQPHEWVADFSGQVKATSGEPSLLMSGIEQPCPPSCSFSVTYALERNR